MLIAWIRGHLAAAIVAGLAVSAGGYWMLGPSGRAPFPARFVVEIDGKGAFPCDLTKNALAACTNNDSILILADRRVWIQLYAADPTRVEINAYGLKQDGIGWAELEKGLVVGRTHLRAFRVP